MTVSGSAALYLLAVITKMLAQLSQRGKHKWPFRKSTCSCAAMLGLLLSLHRGYVYISTTTITSRNVLCWRITDRHTNSHACNLL